MDSLGILPAHAAHGGQTPGSGCGRFSAFQPQGGARDPGLPRATPVHARPGGMAWPGRSDPAVSPAFPGCRRDQILLLENDAARLDGCVLVLSPPFAADDPGRTGPQLRRVYVPDVRRLPGLV